MALSPLDDWPVTELEDLSPEAAARAIVVWFLERRAGAAIVPTQWGIAAKVAQRSYPNAANIKKLQIVIAEGAAWGLANGLLCREPQSGLNHDTFAVTRLGCALHEAGKLDEWLPATGLQRSDLHPTIAAACWDAVVASDYDTAVFKAFRAIEEAVAHALPEAREKSGTRLLNDAFDPSNGKLRDQSIDDPNERVAWRNLFVGAYGAFRNPPAHRSGTKPNEKAVREELMLASLLMRKLDSVLKATAS